MQNIGLSDFLDFTYLSDLHLSTDGQYAAFLTHKCDSAADGYLTELMVTRVHEARTERVASAHRSPVFCWEKEGALLYGRAQDKSTVFMRYDPRRGESTPAFTVDLAARTVTYLNDGRILISAATVLYPEDHQDDDCVIVSELPATCNGAGYISGTRNALFLYDPLTGEICQLTSRFYDVSDYEYCPAQHKIVICGEAFQTKCIINGGISVYDLDTGAISEVLKPGAYRVTYASMLGDQVIFAGTLGRDNAIMENPHFYLLNLPDGALTDLAYPDYYIGGMALCSDCYMGGGINVKAVEDGVYFTSADVGNAPLFRLGKDGKTACVLRLPGSVDHFDVAGGTCAFIGMRDMRLQELYTLSLDSGKEHCLTDLNGAYMRGHRIVRPKPLFFQTDEGDTASGWVMEPLDFDPACAYPAILDIHGGPKCAYGEVYVHEMQVWAQSGYFVFFCNPRGSDGHGDKFSRIFGCNGGKDYEDIMRFTRLVLKRYPQIDPARVGLTGGSYGGYMTNWIVGHSDFFRCAAAQRSIGDWIVHEYNCDTGYWVTSCNFPPNAIARAREAWDNSPGKYDIDCKTPLLFIHSDQDSRCTLPEAMAAYAGAAQGGAAVRMCLFHGETHELSRSGKPLNRLRRLEEITGWMDHYLKEGWQ